MLQNLLATQRTIEYRNIVDLTVEEVIRPAIVTNK